MAIAFVKDCKFTKLQLAVDCMICQAQSSQAENFTPVTANLFLQQLEQSPLNPSKYVNCAGFPYPNQEVMAAEAALHLISNLESQLFGVSEEHAGNTQKASCIAVSLRH